MPRHRSIRRPPPTTDQRPPDVRLEVLVREPNRERALRMLQRIAQDLDAKPEPGPWLAAARSLADRLVISDRVFYYLTEILLECVALEASESDPELLRMGTDMQAIERAHGLTDHESFYLDDAPEDWLALNDAWNARDAAIRLARLRALGHSDIADIWESRPAEFEEKADAGRRELFGAPDDAGDEPPY